MRQNPAEFLKYTVASALALAVDYSCYWVLVSNKILVLPKAAVVGYIAGLVVVYFSIADRVFKDGWLKDKKGVEAFLFLLSGALGIALTFITVKVMVLIFGEKIILAKLTAVGVSFILVFLFRRSIVFRVIR